MKPFKEAHTFDKRSQLATKIRKNYPDRVPVIVEPVQRERRTVTLNQQKYLVPQDSTMGQFLTEVRKNAQISSRDALYLFCDSPKGEVLVPISKSIGDVYQEYKDPCGFLFITVALEQTFG